MRSKSNSMTNFLDIEQLKKALLLDYLIPNLLRYIRWGGVNDYYLRNLNVMQKWNLKIILNKKELIQVDTIYRDLFYTSILSNV